MSDSSIRIPRHEKVILVDPHDRKIGELEKVAAHRYGMLHRAFSVFIFRQTEGVWQLLLQQRSWTKYLAAGLWTNTCCSHPRPGEMLKTAAERRLHWEMGIKAKLQEVGTFHYVAPFDNGLTENEIDHVFIGRYDPQQEITLHPEEVECSLWVDLDALSASLRADPKKYTPWFKPALELALAHKDQLG